MRGVTRIHLVVLVFAKVDDQGGCRTKLVDDQGGCRTKLVSISSSCENKRSKCFFYWSGRYKNAPLLFGKGKWI